MMDKTLTEVYFERNLLAMAFIREYASNHDTSYGWWEDDEGSEFGIVWVDTEVGQVGWHVLKKLIPTDFPERDPEYDGYETPVKNDRVRSIAGVDYAPIDPDLDVIDPGVVDQ